MGFGTVIATGISIVLLIVTAYAVIMGFSAAMDTMTYSMKDIQNLKNDQIKTDVALSEISTNGHEITFQITNTGNTKILNLSMSDIIFTFNRTKNDTVKTSYWMPYRTSLAGSEDAWTKESIANDMINPGILDPGETMSCKAYLLDETWPGSLGWISFTAQNGASASAYFNVTL